MSKPAAAKAGAKVEPPPAEVAPPPVPDRTVSITVSLQATVDASAEAIVSGNRFAFTFLGETEPTGVRHCVSIANAMRTPNP